MSKVTPEEETSQNLRLYKWHYFKQGRRRESFGLHATKSEEEEVRNLEDPIDEASKASEGVSHHDKSLGFSTPLSRSNGRLSPLPTNLHDLHFHRLQTPHLCATDQNTCCTNTLTSHLAHNSIQNVTFVDNH